MTYSSVAECFFKMLIYAKMCTAVINQGTWSKAHTSQHKEGVTTVILHFK